jgi:hypothetical protein
MGFQFKLNNKRPSLNQHDHDRHPAESATITIILEHFNDTTFQVIELHNKINTNW